MRVNATSNRHIRSVLQWPDRHGVSRRTPRRSAGVLTARRGLGAPMNSRVGRPCSHVLTVCVPKCPVAKPLTNSTRPQPDSGDTRAFCHGYGSCPAVGADTDRRYVSATSNGKRSGAPFPWSAIDNANTARQAHRLVIRDTEWRSDALLPTRKGYQHNDRANDALKATCGGAGEFCPANERVPRRVRTREHSDRSRCHAANASLRHGSNQARVDRHVCARECALDHRHGWRLVSGQVRGRPRTTERIRSLQRRHAFTVISWLALTQ